MKTMVKLATLMALFLGVASYATPAHATKWCGFFRAHFLDSNVGEDYYQSEDERDRPAAYALAELQKLNTTTGSYSRVWNGYLDETGCTADIATTAGSFRWYVSPILKRSNRIIRIQATTETTWNGVVGSPVAESVTLTSPVPSLVEVAPNATGRTTQTGLAAGLARFLYHSNNLGLPDNFTAWVGTAGSAIADCANGNAYVGTVNGNHKVCLGSGASQRKFIQAHEFGHVLAGLTGGPLEGAPSDADRVRMPAPADCLCESTTTGHCLNSREFVGLAQQEGFAHFVAARIYNNPAQETNAGGFGYYKSVPVVPFTWTPGQSYGTYIPTVPTPQIDITGDESNILRDPNYQQDRDGVLVQFMKNECLPPLTNHRPALGTEWDWMVFFWNLATKGSAAENYSVTDITALWKAVSDTKREWCCTVTATTGQYGDCNPRTASTCPSGTTKVLIGMPRSELASKAQSKYGVVKLTSFLVRATEAGIY